MCSTAQGLSGKNEGSRVISLQKEQNYSSNPNILPTRPLSPSGKLQNLTFIISFRHGFHTFRSLQFRHTDGLGVHGEDWWIHSGTEMPSQEFGQGVGVQGVLVVMRESSKRGAGTATSGRLVLLHSHVLKHHPLSHLLLMLQSLDAGRLLQKLS